MLAASMEIKPLIGYGDLFLGMTRSEIKTKIGSCDFEESETWFDDSQTDTWEYFVLGLELSFSSEDDFRLTTITIFSKEATLDGISPIGFTEEKLKKNFQNVELDEDLKELGKNYVYPDYEIAFWLNDNIVENLTLFPKYEQDQETIIWPKRS